jgi:hypothetical protein
MTILVGPGLAGTFLWQKAWRVSAVDDISSVAKPIHLPLELQAQRFSELNDAIEAVKGFLAWSGAL